jgi:hypothetical protein
VSTAIASGPEAVGVRKDLDAYALELDKRSKEEAEVNRELEPLEEFIEEALNDFEVSCWDKHVQEEAKLPSEAMRIRLAKRTMPAEILANQGRLIARRKRLERRQKALQTLIDARRSSLSALKSELEATG